MTEKDRFIRYRLIIGFQRCPDYLNWMKGRSGNLTLHHILGSSGKRKHTDFLVMPLENFFHNEVVHRNKAKYFFEYLEQSFRYLVQYCIEKNLCTPEELPTDLEPETLAIFIECIYRRIVK